MDGKQRLGLAQRVFQVQRLEVKEGKEMGRWISNWFSNMLPLDKPFKMDGISYKTVENYYQAMKTTDVGERAKIAAMDPKEAKRYCKKIAVRSDWDKIKRRVMWEALEKKFARGTSWAKRLLETGDEDIVEYNNWGDTFWGMVKGPDGEWVGENNLGKQLMVIRSLLR